MKVHSFTREVYPLAVRLKLEASKVDDRKVLIVHLIIQVIKIRINYLISLIDCTFPVSNFCY